MHLPIAVSTSAGHVAYALVLLTGPAAGIIAILGCTTALILSWSLRPGNVVPGALVVAGKAASVEVEVGGANGNVNIDAERYTGYAFGMGIDKADVRFAPPDEDAAGAQVVAEQLQLVLRLGRAGRGAHAGADDATGARAIAVSDSGGTVVAVAQEDAVAAVPAVQPAAPGRRGPCGGAGWHRRTALHLADQHGHRRPADRRGRCLRLG